MLARIAPAIRVLSASLLRSRLLLLYVILGLLSGLAGGIEGLWQSMFNYALLALYVLVVYLLTTRDCRAAPSPPFLPPEKSRLSAGRQLLLPALLIAWNLAFSALFHLQGPPMAALRAIRDSLLAAGWDQELAGTAANATVVSAGVLIPALALTFAFGLRLRFVGLVPRHLYLALALILLGIALSGASQLAFGRSSRLFAGPEQVPLALAIFAVHVFVNGLPEEFIYRGVVLSRLLLWLRHPHHALLLSSVAFSASHLPSLLIHPPAPLPWWIITAGVLLTPSPQPTGLVWGYLFYRTRSIWPGALWHTSFVTLGVLFT